MRAWKLFVRMPRFRVKPLLTNERMSLEQLTAMLKGTFEEVVEGRRGVYGPLLMSIFSNFIKFRIITIPQYPKAAAALTF